MPVPNSTLIKTETELERLRLEESWERRRLENEERRRIAESQRVGSLFAHPFWTAFSDIGPIAKCLDEWLIIEISWTIRSKPNWESKYKTPEIRLKWENEIKEQCKDKTKFIDEVIEYVFKEIEWYDETQNNLQTFKIGCEDKIVYSDQVIDKSCKDKFRKKVDELVGSLIDLDYHPGSNNQVIDIVHPSLFPLQYGVTPIIIDNLEIVEYHPRVQNAKPAVADFGVSKNYQWLPALLTYDDGFKFKSYINNLHPFKHKQLYTSIESIFNRIIPGLNYTLSRYASEDFIRIPIPTYLDAYNEDYEKDRDALEELLDKEAEKTDEGFDYDKFDEFEQQKIKYLKEFKPSWSVPNINKSIDLKTFKNLKVIVKLANIELTPDSPKYNGGSWHVEGTINEDIIATVLYYYDCENISESRLSFRTGFEDPQYEQGDSTYAEAIFGIKDEDLMVRNIGSMQAQEDRVLVFPNMFQHHVDPFELKDKSKPGHRKILCFFICDPFNKYIVSSDNVPPQQKEWWDDESLGYLYPGNIKQEILNLKDNRWPITLNDAKIVREKLMEERSSEKIQGDEDDMPAFNRLFSLCEH
ncbi:unnamed protein product [Candida verbasci]|uniref:Uncharacterized protein n=1 Tax=Candida verbasci TaxID=1227364 RepID=A0A9W4TUY9_9ASCO|nr:unnamed protein product [Candida verbasci]